MIDDGKAPIPERPTRPDAIGGDMAAIVHGFATRARLPALLRPGVTASRVGAAAISLGLTSGLMVWARVPHPPAGATTLIESLGILQNPGSLPC
jgi:CBS domain-containing membrane protein